MMVPVVTPEDMRAFDLASPVPIPVLIERAGAAVAAEAIRMLGGTYGRRVLLLAGTGNNGADGIAAARILERRGVRVQTIMATRHLPLPVRLPAADLIIDAILGTGFTGTFTAPETGSTPVLSIDLPSGLDGLSGLVRSPNRAIRADRTVTFAGWKPGLLFGRGPELAGVTKVVDIGLPVQSSVHVVDAETVAHRLPIRSRNAHKWNAAVLVVGGSAGMTGAPSLAAAAAMRAGCGLVRIGVPGVEITGTEAVGVPMPAEQWGGAALLFAERCGAMVLGPGLGRNRVGLAAVRATLGRASMPVVLDGDGLAALGADGGEEPDTPMHTTLQRVTTAAVVTELSPGQRAIREASARRVVTPIEAAPSSSLSSSNGRGGTVSSIAAAGSARAVVRAIDSSFGAAERVLSARTPGTTVLTPHDGEYERITGKSVGANRILAAQRLAAATGAVVLLKGATTVIADHEGRTELVRHGDERLATAGSGDVLSGIIGALIAQGLAPFEAASTGAYLHAECVSHGPAHGLIASDLVAGLAKAWTGLINKLQLDHQ
jgi:ADP-dependent NAD(P)H-hydrate dehydratase / NAD(P)H-hydrate epimerase